MPKPRSLTDEQENAALAKYRAANGKHGILSQLARENDVTPAGMQGILYRAELRDLKDSRESLSSAGAQP